jgi:hypothetical protein
MHSSTHSYSRLQMEMSGQLHDPAALVPAKVPRYVLYRRVCGYQTSLILLTAWCKILFEKLIVTQLIKQ